MLLSLLKVHAELLSSLQISSYIRSRGIYLFSLNLNYICCHHWVMPKTFSLGIADSRYNWIHFSSAHTHTRADKFYDTMNNQITHAGRRLNGLLLLSAISTEHKKIVTALADVLIHIYVHTTLHTIYMDTHKGCYVLDNAPHSGADCIQHVTYTDSAFSVVYSIRWCGLFTSYVCTYDPHYTWYTILGHALVFHSQRYT